MKSLIFLVILILSSSSLYGICGDSFIESNEQCDDGNIINGDGCSSTCSTEVGWSCSKASFNLDFAEVFDGKHRVNPEWILTNEGRTLNQLKNSDPGIYVSTLPVNNHTVEFTLEVKTYHDDDFIGWAIGYEEGENDSNNIDWILFDWKQTTQASYGANTAYAGLNMWRVNDKIDGAPSIWAHEAMTKIATGLNYGTVGWADNTTYHVKMNYTTTNIKIYVNDILEFDIDGSFWGDAKLSFYTYSQREDEFILTAPLEGSICNEVCGDGIKMPLEECDDGNELSNDGCFGCIIEDGWRCSNSSPSSCDDINECLEEFDNCHEKAICTNTNGSFSCSCKNGYSGDGVNCNDIDECILNQDNCTQICSNRIGSFSCSCENGYHLNNDGFTCSEINKCDPNPCKNNGKCINNINSYLCNCEKTGFSGTNCEIDIDECVTETDTCNKNATCLNTIGGFACSCNEGYKGDGIICNDINECLDKNSCSQICINTKGGFTCECELGYRLNADQRGCHDINECLLSPCDKNATCTNNLGSFSCRCNEGYFADGKICKNNNYQGSSLVGCDYSSNNNNFFFLLLIFIMARLYFAIIKTKIG